MIEQRDNRMSRKGAIIGIALTVLVVVALDLYAERNGLSYRELIVTFAALIGAVVVFGGERGIRFGLVLWVPTLALGYRSIYWTIDLPILPAEILLWLLLCCILVQRQLLSTTRLILPFWLWLLLPFWALAWWPLISGDARWDVMLNEFRGFLLLLPLMIVAPVVLERERYWRYLLLAFFIASTWIAFMGVLEYWFPAVTKVFPEFVRSTTVIMTQEGFGRAQFSFWGSPAATFVCMLALPSAIVLAAWWHNWLQRAAIAAASGAQMAAIYIGGYRSIWLMLLIQVLLACALGLKKQGVVVALLCLVVAAGGYQFIPRTNERAISGLAALQGRPTDSSALKRKTRALDALNSAIESPLGSGWSSAGWVHSDFLQVAANLGIIAGLIFLGGYLYTLLRLGRRVVMYLRSGGEPGGLGFSLLLSFVGVGGLLAMEGVSVLPQMVLPVWFVWVMVEVWLRQTSDLRAFKTAPAPLSPNKFGQLNYSRSLRIDV